MYKCLFWVLAITGVCIAAVCGIQVVMAVRFQEFGRVMIYLIGFLLSVELAVYEFFRIFRRKKNDS